jgi:Protein of unknown function (DUF4435)
MPKYNPSGYLAATLDFRSNRTLMVEGPKDRVFASALIHELASRPAAKIRNVTVDTAEMIQDASLPGNRERVESVHAVASANSKEFAALVDREYREFSTSSPIADCKPVHNVIDNTLFWTRGHSAENYFLTLGTFWDVLRTIYATRTPINFHEQLAKNWESILHECAAISLAAKAGGVLRRLSRSFDYHYWTVNPANALRVDESRLQSLLQGEGLVETDAAAFVVHVGEYRNLLAPASKSLARWICHGHVGCGLAWAAVGYLLLQSGGSVETARKVAMGDAHMKHKISAMEWSKTCKSSDEDSPVALMNWILS